MISDYEILSPVHKGWSDDEKYHVRGKDGAEYLLRVSKTEKYEQRKHEFDLMRRADALGVPLCTPVWLGVENDRVYTVQKWIRGADMEEAVRHMTEDEKYRFGLDAGRYLALLHTLPAPADAEAWDIRFNRKTNTKIDRYTACPLHYPDGERLLSFIEDGRPLLQGRPQTFRHGDYHIGNMMLDESGRLVIIDFDRADHGDPWEEFNRIVWSAQSSPAFATGTVDGYFDGPVPMDFWRLLLLYISSNTLSSLCWALPFGQKEIDTMLAQEHQVMAWYSNLSSPVPTWYQKKDFL